MKRFFRAIMLAAIAVAAVAFGPPALASPTMGSDLIAAYSQTTSTPYDIVKDDFSGRVAVAPAASASGRSTAGSEPLTYSQTNCPTASQTSADASGVVGPGWRSTPTMD